jgi:hypothetical protein
MLPPIYQESVCSRDIFIDEETPPNTNHNPTPMEVPSDNSLSAPTHTKDH